MNEEMTTAAWLHEFADKAEENLWGWWRSYYHKVSGETFSDYRALVTTAFQSPEKIARKPRMIALTGPGGTYYYPEPLREEPPLGTEYWIPKHGAIDFGTRLEWESDEADQAFLRRGLVHLDQAAAREHAVAEIKAAGFEL